MIDVKKLIELLKLLKKQEKEIDDCPYFSHSLTIIDRIMGRTVSQADQLKHIARLRMLRCIINTL